MLQNLTVSKKKTKPKSNKKLQQNKTSEIFVARPGEIRRAKMKFLLSQTPEFHKGFCVYLRKRKYTKQALSLLLKGSVSNCSIPLALDITQVMFHNSQYENRE